MSRPSPTSTDPIRSSKAAAEVVPSRPEADSFVSPGLLDAADWSRWPTDVDGPDRQRCALFFKKDGRRPPNRELKGVLLGKAFAEDSDMFLLICLVQRLVILIDYFL